MKKLTYAVMMLLTLGVIAACSESDDDEKTATPKEPIVGTWLSTGKNVAPILHYLFSADGGVDSVTAVFMENNRYTVKQINKNKTTKDYVGSYTVDKSANLSIIKIKLEQESPGATSNEGIYQIFTASPDSMKYEVVQLSSTSNTAPTPEKGFGSTNNGAFGVNNIQRYIRLK